MYTYYNIYGEKATGLEPTDDLLEAVKNADKFEVIVHDTETKLDVYDIRKATKWNAKWIAKRIGNPEEKGDE